MKSTPLHLLLALGAIGLAPAPHADDLPVLSTGHTDVGINYEDDHWDLHVHAEDLDEEFAPDAVWLKVGQAARTVVPSAPAFGFLGTAGATVWVLPAINNPDLLFLGLGTEELAPGIFAGDIVSLALKQVEGPGDFIVYQLDAFGSPIVSFNSRDGIDASDIRSLAAGGHTHVNWAFTAPGQYRIGLQASGTLIATGETTTSEVAEYRFDVGELPRLVLARDPGPDRLRLEWQSETNATYQIQFRPDATAGTWTNLGSPAQGTGSLMTESITPDQTARFFRVLVDYHAGTQ